MTHTRTLTAALLAALLLAGCTFTVRMDVVSVGTPTPATAGTAQPTDAPTGAPTPTETATATPAPPTATPQPTPPPVLDKPTPPPVQATGALTVNVPLLAAATGDPALDANNWAIVWAGSVSPDGNYAQCRMVGATDGARVYCQMWTPAAAGDSVALVMGARTLAIAHDVPAGWTVGQRCGGTDGTGCRGWTAYAFLPWGQWGKPPQPGDVWPLSLSYHGATWAGALRWGLPDYAGRAVDGAQIITATLSADAMLGGGTDCGAPAYPEYFPAWGALDWQGSPYVNVQAQWDVADWPCYSRYYAGWGLGALPEGARVVSATLTLSHFGNPGYGTGYATDGTGDTVIQVWDTVQALTVPTWDGAPVGVENISRTTVKPIDATCSAANLDATRTCRPGVPVGFDVTASVQRAVQRGDSAAGVLLYTAAGQYHAGKHFWGRGTAEQPVISIAYTMPGDVWTPTATPTATATPIPATATLTPPPTATATASPSATPRPSATPTPTPEPTLPIAPTTGKTYHVAVNGNDANPGTAAQPWATFARAWRTMQAGDTLLIGDGTYTEPIQPLVAGVAGAPITIKAVNDGKVIIDGRGQTIPIKLGDNWPGDNRSYITVEGVVARNGTDATVRIRGDHMVLRRVSAYDAQLRLNSSVIAVVWASDVLLEDVIAAGTGRKSILVFTSERVTVRRAFTQWQAWDGQTADTCAMGWPAGNGINPYNSKYVTVENALVTGPMADAGLRVTINHESVYSPGMQVLGSIAVGAGMDGARPHAYPLVADPACTVPPGGPPYTASAWGMGVYGQGDAPGVVFRDVLAAGNAGWGFASLKPSGVGVTNGVLDHATLCGNNTQPGTAGERGVQGTYGGFTVTNSLIPGFQAGEGARLDRRYVDGVRTDAPLLPWPMQARAAAELGVDVGAMWQRYAGACK